MKTRLAFKSHSLPTVAALPLAPGALADLTSYRLLPGSSHAYHSKPPANPQEPVAFWRFVWAVLAPGGESPEITVVCSELPRKKTHSR